MAAAETNRLADEGDVIVSLRDVWVHYNGVPVLEGVDFSIRKDSYIAVIGPNGGGKSTLLRVVMGLIRPDRGTVSVFGKTPLKGRRYIGYLPQSKPSDLGFPISVYEVVLSGRYSRPLCGYTAEDREAALKALEDVDMDAYRNRQIGRLSGGQIQRVFLARAIARDPKLLLLDEPTASIDPEQQKNFYSLLERLRKKMAVVFVTHDIGAVSEYFDEIACLNRRLFYHGDAEGGAEKLAEAYTCPVEFIGHGTTPHRVLRDHGVAGDKKPGGGKLYGGKKRC